MYKVKQFESDISSANISYKVIQKEIKKLEINITKLEAEKQRYKAKAESLEGILETHLIDLDSTNILSPITGIIANRIVEPGVYMKKGWSLMSVVPIHDVWVIANFKETQIKKLAVGQVVYSAMCYENGTMIDDGTLYKLGDHNFRWICGSDYSGEWLTQLSEELKLHTNIKSSTDHLHNISVQGPNSRKVLSKIIWTPPSHPDVNNLEWFHFTISRIGDHKGIPIMLSRTGYTGELGFEIYCHPNDASKVWDAVWDAGKEFNISPMGFEALDILRIEAGLILGGNEFSDETDPFEAGISFTVPLKTKEQNFIGKEALIERKAHPHRKLVGLEIEGNEKVNHGDCVHSGRAQVGIITSGTISPTLNKNIALCRIDVRSSELDTKLEIGKLDGHQKRISAKVVPFPFYDPTKSKVRA